MVLANATHISRYNDCVNIRNYAPILMKQGYAILDSQNLHIKMRRCNSEMLVSARSSVISGILVISSVIYELSK